MACCACAAPTQEGQIFKWTISTPTEIGSPCVGNGTRAICQFYHGLRGGEGVGNYTFETQNGVYHGRVQGDFVKVQMTEVYDRGAVDIGDLIPEAKFSYYINTGVPHCVYEVEGLSQYDVEGQGKRVRRDERFPQGVNCNFFERLGERIHIRTFERGVEGETLACGTGVLAVALSLHQRGERQSVYECQVQGGEISIEVESPEKVERVYLCGKVDRVF